MNLDLTLTQLEAAQLVRHLIEEKPAYIFKHALTQATTYESVLKNKRREIHQRVAFAMEEIFAHRLDENAAILAQHFAEAGLDAKIAEYATRAGDVATRVFAYPEARVHYARALEAIARLSDDDANRRRRADTIIKQVAVSLRSAGPAETIKRLSEAETLAQPFAENANAPREDRVRLARIYFWQGHALLHHGDSRAAVEKMRAVMTIAQAENEPPLLAVAANIIGRSLTLRGQFAQALPILSDAIIALEQTHDENEWIFGVGMRGFCFAMRGQVARGIAEAERTLARAHQVGTLTGTSVAHFIIAMTRLFGDSIPGALEHARGVIETAAKSGDRLHAYVGHGFLAWAQTRAGQWDDAEKSFTQAEAIAQAIGGRLAFSDWFMAARTENYFRRGEYTRARDLAQEAIALTKSSGVIFFTGLAHRLCAQARAHMPNENWDAIENHCTASLQCFEEGDARIEIARTHLAWGKILLERDNATSARDHFERAAAQFETAGLARELAETRALMREEHGAN